MDESWHRRINQHLGGRDSKLRSVCEGVHVPKSRLNVTSVPRECGLLSALQVEITEETDVTTLLANMASGKWTALQVMQAFAKRAVIAHELVNCLTEVFFDQALKRAEALDDYYRSRGKTVGPLHGLPISLKDQFNVKDTATTMGYVGWLDKTAHENSVMVDMLESQGAICYVKTNVPFSLMRAETLNNIFGLTTCPLNRSLTCGGSSGGEGALIAMGGSPLGVGSDIGGSIRIPAAFCGLYGLKPSHGRFPYYGVENSMAGQESVHSTLGPLSRSLDGLLIFAKALLSPAPGVQLKEGGNLADRTDGPLHAWNLDPKVINLPWRQATFRDAVAKKPLRVGLIRHNGIARPHPPILRGLEMVEKALRKAGHEVFEWDASDHQDGLDLLLKFYGADSGEDIYEAAASSGECIPPGTVLPTRGGPQLSLKEVWTLQIERTKYQRRYLDRLSSGDVDILIGPVAPYASVQHEGNKDISYTGIFNLLDFASCVFPVTTVDQTLDGPLAAKSRGTDDDIVAGGAKTVPEFDVERWVDAPVCLQAIGRRLNEEWVLGVTQQVCEALQCT